jgi:8-hydroxy-5-deazaflavin:NADPH oxidoreductase
MKEQNAAKPGRRSFLNSAFATAAALIVGGVPSAARAAGSPSDGLKIGVIGSGNIGGNLGGIWVKAGHEVMFSSLDLEHDKALAARLGSNARAGTSREAATFGDVILMAVPYRALPAVGKDLGDVIKGKVVIDATNPIVARDGEIATWAREKGAGLASAQLLPGARIVRAFNAVGAARLPAIAQSQGERTGMPIAGDDASAIAVASRLVRDAGFEPVVVGPLIMGRHLIPGTPLAGERSPEQIRQIVSTLK